MSEKNSMRPIGKIGDDARRVLILRNPSAGARSRKGLVDQLIAELAARRMLTSVLDDLDALSEAVADQEEGELRAVVAAGGDGTVSAVVNRVPEGTPVALLPLGTENLFAKYLNVSARPDTLSQRIEQGNVVNIDAGQAGDRLFLLMVGIGFDADVVHRLHRTRKGHIRHFSYFKPIVDSIRSYGYPPFRLYCSRNRGDLGDRTDGNTVSGVPTSTVRWAFVVNLPRYATGLRLVPDAVGNDGWLDVCTFERGSLFNGLRYLARVILGRHADLADVSVWKTTGLRLESDAPVPYQLDGDPGGMLPVEIRVLPERVAMVVDESWAVEHGFRPEPRAFGG